MPRGLAGGRRKEPGRPGRQNPATGPVQAASKLQGSKSKETSRRQQVTNSSHGRSVSGSASSPTSEGTLFVKVDQQIPEAECQFALGHRANLLFGKPTQSLALVQGSPGQVKRCPLPKQVLDAVLKVVRFEQDRSFQLEFDFLPHLPHNAFERSFARFHGTAKQVPLVGKWDGFFIVSQAEQHVLSRT
jgi:hypothetical protein